MVEVYSKKARHINVQDPLHRHAYTQVSMKCKKSKERSGGRKKLPVPGSGIEPTTLTVEGKAPVCIATFTLHKDLWLQLLYEYHEGYILISIAQYPMHMKDREKVS